MTVDGGGVEKLLLFLEEIFLFRAIFFRNSTQGFETISTKKIYTYICDSLNDDMIYSLLFD